jgi:hypothetical protein
MIIDYSNEIFNAVATDLRSEYKGIKVVGEYVASPTVFPTVTIDEIQNTPTHLDSAVLPKYAEVVYRVQIFCNGNGKRAKARKIYGTVAERLSSMGLVGVTYTTTPAIYNSEIYCITGTFRGVMDRDGVIYRG